MFDRSLLNTVLYLITWALKIAADILLKVCTLKGSIKIWHCKFVNYSQKAHLMFFNVAVLDALVFCTRTIIHSRELGFLENALAVITLAFVVYDFTEIWSLGARFLHPSAYTADLLKSNPPQSPVCSIIDKDSSVHRLHPQQINLPNDASNRKEDFSGFEIPVDEHKRESANFSNDPF